MTTAYTKEQLDPYRPLFISMLKELRRQIFRVSFNCDKNTDHGAVAEVLITNMVNTAVTYWGLDEEFIRYGLQAIMREFDKLSEVK